MQFRNNPEKETVRVYKCKKCGEIFKENSGNAPTKDVRNHINENHPIKSHGYESILGFPKDEL